MSKHMDQQAKTLIVMMKHHLNLDYVSNENKQRDIDMLIKDFRHLDSLDVIHFSQGVWNEMNELFESYRLEPQS